MRGELCHTIPCMGRYLRPSSICGRGRRHLPPWGKALSRNKGYHHVSSILPICSSPAGAGGVGYFAVSQLFTAAAAAACGTVAGFVLRPAAGADGTAGLYQPGPAGPWHRLCRASGDLLLHRHRHWAGAAPHRRHAAGRLAYFLAWRHNAVAADCRNHVVGPPPGAAPLYDPLPPYDPQKAAGRPAAHRADQRHSPPKLRRNGSHPHP